MPRTTDQKLVLTHNVTNCFFENSGGPARTRVCVAACTYPMRVHNNTPFTVPNRTARALCDTLAVMIQHDLPENTNQNLTLLHNVINCFENNSDTYGRRLRTCRWYCSRGTRPPFPTPNNAARNLCNAFAVMIRQEDRTGN